MNRRFLEPSTTERRPDRRAVADWTLNRLHEMVLSGELRPGDVLSEVELTERLGVSRSPVRDALKELEHSGLLDVDDVNGRRVLRPFLPDDVAELYNLRIELEALAARYAARNSSQTVVQQLTDSLTAMQDAVREPVEVWLPRDFAFHSVISVASGTRRVPRLLTGVWIQHQAFLRRLDRVGAYPSTLEERLDVIRDHERILVAIGEGDPAKADAALRRHLQRRQEIVLTALRASGGVDV